MKANLKHTMIGHDNSIIEALSFQSDFSSRLLTTRLLFRLEF